MGKEVIPAESVPGYCWNCGKPYPWTLKFLSAAREVIGDLQELIKHEKTELFQSIDDAVRQVPGWAGSIERIKSLCRTLKKPSQDLLNNVLANGIYDFLKGLFS